MIYTNIFSLTGAPIEKEKSGAAASGAGSKYKRGSLFILQERRLKERNQGQQQQGQELGIIRGSKKGVHLAYFTGAPAEGEESGATTAGAGVRI